MLIGCSEQRNGLYYFRSMDVAAAMHATKMTSPELWHQRLGHPSSKALKFLSISDSMSNVKFDHKAYNVCIRAKQSRATFPISLNKTTSVFELVHFDLWGPYRTPTLCGSTYVFDNIG